MVSLQGSTGYVWPCTLPTRKNPHGASKLIWLYNRTHTNPYLEQTSLSNSQLVLALPTAAKPTTKFIPQYWNSFVFVACVSPKPRYLIQRNSILPIFFSQHLFMLLFTVFEAAILVRAWGWKINKLEMQRICFPLTLYTVLTRVIRPLVLGKPLISG